MAGSKALTWGETGTRLFEAGVSKGVLYVWDKAQKKYGKGVAWPGLTSVPESPEGAETNAYYADNIKYLNITGKEEFKTTIGAYCSPEEFDACDGSVEIVQGVYAGQQTRSKFCFCWRTELGNDTESTDYGYVIHIAYNCSAAPSEKEHNTINESVEPPELSWEVTTTPVEITGYKPTAHIKIKSTKCDPDKLAALEKKLYGDTEDPQVLMPDEIVALVGAAAMG